jgi:DNA-directed RNA polymerase sigma subunit (sigma70/sigma32)
LATTGRSHRSSLPPQEELHLIVAAQRPEGAASGLLPTQVHQLMRAGRLPRGLQEPIGRDDGAGATLGDLLADPRAEDADEEVSDRLDLAVLPRLLQTLTEREALIVCAHYGLDGSEQTLRQLGEGLGLSAELVRQIEQGAMEKMRVAFAAVRPAACVS